MKYGYRQKGVAAILFVIIFPFFLGFFALTIEGSRYMTDSARLSDVMESAALAVAASVNHDDDKTMVQDYIAATVPQADVKPSDITITTKTCEQIYGSDCGKPGVYDKNGLRFNEYDVSVTSHFVSWFPGNKVVVGFNKNQTLFNKAVARKYQQDSVDVVFVTDFSGSMLNPWANTQKYKGVIDIVKQISGVLGKYNDIVKTSGYKNKAAVVPYDNYTRTLGYSTNEYGGHWETYKDYQVCTFRGFFGHCFHWEWHYSTKWVQSQKDEYGIHVIDSVPCYDNPEYNIPDDSRDRIEGGRQGYPFNSDCVAKYLSVPYFLNDDSYASSSKQSGGDFYQIPLTSDMASLSQQISSFSPYHKGGTSSFEGLLPAVRILASADSTNKKKIIIFLSDGQDNNSATAGDGIGNQLYNNHICDNIRSYFKNKGDELTIAFIGFDYDVTTNPGLTACAGDNNIFQASKNYQEIYNRILELITEKIGHLYNHDYKVNN
ncbi:TadE/TadG family type IV pilus assembly protein [Celerinatantimonas diazotrophica]|uniref:Flp pilus assembly protein TadG n=1 Tax=Celerinatantimonas diazotrophica TaxID=412034 RepID=A0A4R1KH06_9GAMM|nr:TadE/TadG family type IV pilus assembly protein [Celerinatantimonas diazotrophica]TCK64002.1 Flp pilus assembly protein TadG [Celerinatantimonas diazotrophica]CAG9297093.1 hypothetical protein CEDIAZO_02260 [Celerinatantimonas diazotrophica]